MACVNTPQEEMYLLHRFHSLTTTHVRKRWHTKACGWITMHGGTRGDGWTNCIPVLLCARVKGEIAMVTFLYNTFSTQCTFPRKSAAAATVPAPCLLCKKKPYAYQKHVIGLTDTPIWWFFTLREFNRSKKPKLLGGPGMWSYFGLMRLKELPWGDTESTRRTFIIPTPFVNIEV